MNRNFTQPQTSILNFLGSTNFKTSLVTAIALFALVVAARSQNTDLPNPTANLQTAPAGSLVIAMDNSTQARPGYFNLKAYGLAVYLMNNNRRLRWAITAGKAKDGTDMSVTAAAISPTTITASSKITVTLGSPIATVNTVVGTLMVGMQVSAPGVTAGTTIAGIISPTQFLLSASATSNQLNRNATYSIDATQVLPHNFKAGPFIIFPADTIGVRSLINGFNSGLPATERVNVYRTTANASVDIRYDMVGLKPKAAILDDGGSVNIHVQYMINAAVPPQNYLVLPSATGLNSDCFTFASEPHIDNPGAFIDTVRKFVTLGGNFLAQCHAATTYENWAGGRFQSTLGMVDANTNISGNIAYVNNDLSISQFDGLYRPNQGGSVQTITFAAGSAPAGNFYGIVRGNTAPLANIYGITGTKVRSGKGGNVYYIGNHEFVNTTVESLNGQRVYLNAFLTPAEWAFCPGYIILPVKLKYFTARRSGAKQVQLDWAAENEQDAKEYIIERSADGRSFAELTRVAAKTNSVAGSTYSVNDLSPMESKNFYRLVQVDRSGAKVYSDIVIVKMDIATAGMDIFPNPAHGLVNINLTNVPAYNNALSVTDMTGKIMINRTSISGSAIKLNVANLPGGTYIVKVITADGKLVQQKLLVANNR